MAIASLTSSFASAVLLSCTTTPPRRGVNDNRYKTPLRNEARTGVRGFEGWWTSAFLLCEVFSCGIYKRLPGDWEQRGIKQPDDATRVVPWGMGKKQNG